MAEINQIIDSLAHLPNGIDHPIAAAGTLVVAAAALITERGVFNHTDDDWAAQFPNAALLEKSVTPDLKRVRRARLAPALAVTAGLGLAAVQFFGNPTYESTTADHDAKLIVVEDVSLSMLHSADLGDPKLTRLAAVTGALQEASYPGSLGIVQAGAKVLPTANLSADWKTNLAQAEKPQVDPNGGQMVTALNLAASLLPTAKNGQHEGSLLVISDGTIDDTASEIAIAASALRRSGVTIKVIVPGTAQGKYELGASKQLISSGASANVFAAFGSKNIIEAKDAKTVNHAIKESLSDAGTSHENHTWYIPGMIGALLLGGGVLTDKWQRATRKI